jgi:hypothetical protein
MASPYVLPDAFLEFREAPRLGLLREQCPVEILGAVPTDTPYHDTIILDIPLQDRSRYEFETLAYLGGNRDLSLRGDPGLREFHAGIVPR